MTKEGPYFNRSYRDFYNEAYDFIFSIFYLSYYEQWLEHDRTNHLSVDRQRVIRLRHQQRMVSRHYRLTEIIDRNNR